jgi:hypothetical protein
MQPREMRTHHDGPTSLNATLVVGVLNTSSLSLNNAGKTAVFNQQKE